MSTVPTGIPFAGRELKIEGRFPRIARIAEGYEFLDEPESFIASLKASSHKADILTFVQRLSEPSPRFAYPVESDNFAVLSVSSYDEWFKKQLGNKTRNLIRKAEKSGVTVREMPFDDECVAGISALNNESPVRQGRPFWHYGDDLDTVRRKNGSFAERSVFIGAFLENELVGYIKMTHDDRLEQAGLMQIMSMIRHRDKAPTNLLVASAVRACAERSIQRLFYARYAYRHKKPDSLADFKRHNGFVRYDIPRYFVPLTVGGRVALLARLHHGLAARLPLELVETIKNTRARYHSSGIPAEPGSYATKSHRQA